MTKTRLTDLQSVLLSAAAKRDRGSMLPAPASVISKPVEVTKALRQLLKRKLVAEVGSPVTDAVWRTEGDHRFGLVLTDEGRAAIGVAPDSGDSSLKGSDAPDTSEVPPHLPAEPSSVPLTKTAQVLALLSRPDGATLVELVAATGWLPHTTRAALTGLRKKGHDLVKSKRTDATCYTIVSAQA